MRLVQIGVGTVGSAVVRLLLENRDRWRTVYGLEVGYAALIDSRGVVFNRDCIADAALYELLEAKAAGASLAEVPQGRRAGALETLRSMQDYDDVVLVDCAAGEGTYEPIREALSAGGLAVLSNKAPLAVTQDRFDQLRVRSLGSLGYEATVGAGLPVISTLRSLLDTGDEVEEIQTCASGTLGYITSELMAGSSYSEAVTRAKVLGYTEPDPRDDLSGLDVARKALILARTFGRRLELSEIQVEPLLPPLDPSLSVNEFLEALPRADSEFAERVDRARQAGYSLKYVATIPAEGEIRVGLDEVPAQSLIGSLSGPDNIFAFRTHQYQAHPLTIIGPGAGPENTAMGVLADLLHLARCA